MRRVFFNEFNVRMGKTCYLPLVSGLLRAYAETSQQIRENYQFMPFLYHMDNLPKILSNYDQPDVAAFSASMWNEQLNLAVAAEVKRRWPNCLTVFGGPQVPHDPFDYFSQHPFIDVAVRAEGEEPFADILHRHLETDDFSDIAAVSFRDRRTGEVKISRIERAFKRELDSYPSPYLEGLYDDLVAGANETLEFQAIIETNRGCPFLCTFCYWGRGGLTRKYRYHDMERVFAEIDWCGRNHIRYVFNADSNFGMHQRDMEIAQFIVETKRNYGFPEKFRTCFGKNTDEKIFQIGLLLHRHGLEKGITLARQSNDQQTLKNIKRANIKMSTYRNLQARFNDKEIPIYSELILGLPGETIDSWKRGIGELLEAGLKNQLFIYLCQVFPNTELGEMDYQAQFGIKTQRIALNEIHGSVRDDNWVAEYEDIIVSTSSMSLKDWRYLVIFSWSTMVLHSMKTGFFVMIYLLDRYGVKLSDFISYVTEGRMPVDTGHMFRAELAEYNRLLDGMLERGLGRGTVMPDYGEIYWDVEEASLLRIAENLDQFYTELYEILIAFLSEREIAFDPEELREVVRYQRACIPARYPPAVTEHDFSCNLPEYFDTAFSSTPVPLRPVRQLLRVHPVDFAGDKKQFAQETVLWGRKSGTMLVKATYQRTPVMPGSDEPMAKGS